MLWRLVGKLLFKATLPVVILAGVLTYGYYMRGGDPAAVWTRIASSTSAQIERVFSDAGSRSRDAVGAVVGAGGQLIGDGDAGSGNRTRVYTWQDADGVTHYSSEAPVDVRSRTVLVDPDVNVLAPVRAPASARSDAESDHGANTKVRGDATADNRKSNATARDGALALSRSDKAAIKDVADQLDGVLPGMAGQVLSTGSDGTFGAAQLIKMLE